VEFTFPAFTADGRLVSLTDVLGHVRGERWQWRLLDFEGTALPGSALDAVALERRLRAGTQGEELRFDALLRLAGQMDQPINLALVASPPGDPSTPALTIETRDSTDWRVTADDATPEALDDARRIADNLR
jgi:hypothetical protein